MKRLAYILSYALIVLSCSGKVDPETDTQILTLKADTDEIVADGKSKVNFTVLNGSEDVTATSTISCKSGNAVFSGTSFSTATEGTYRFSATYNGKESKEVTITATAPVVSAFQRHVCVMEFTGTWCSMCPKGAETLNYLVSRTYKDKAFALAFHNNDAYALPQEQELQKIFGWESYPAYVTDMRASDCGGLNDGTCGNSIEKSLYDVPTHCAAAVSCSYDNSKSQADVKARIFSEKAGKYRIAAYVVEDKVIGEQTLGTGDVQKDYTHRHMVRKMLSANVRGDDMGQIGKNQEKEKTYSFTIDPVWNLDNLSIAVLAINEQGEVNNMAVCPVNGGKMDYVYLK